MEGEALEVKEGKRDKLACRGSRMVHLKIKVEVKMKGRQVQGQVQGNLEEGGNLNHLLLMKIFQGMLTSFSYTWS